MEEVNVDQDQKQETKTLFEPVIHKSIELTPLPGGWLVKVGCQHVVYADKDKLIKDFTAYINDPQQVEKEFYANKNTSGPMAAECGGGYGMGEAKDARVSKRL
jgi:hypothetical protein